MKLIEGDRIHMANVGNTYKLSIAGDDDDDDDDDVDDPTFIHHDENHDGDCDTCLYIQGVSKKRYFLGFCLIPLLEVRFYFFTCV